VLTTESYRGELLLRFAYGFLRALPGRPGAGLDRLRVLDGSLALPDLILTLFLFRGPLTLFGRFLPLPGAFGSLVVQWLENGCLRTTRFAVTPRRAASGSARGRRRGLEVSIAFGLRVG